jgi:hypothetical protein
MLNKKPFNFEEWQKDPTRPLWLANGDRVVEIKYYPKEYDDKLDTLYMLCKSNVGYFMYDSFLCKDGVHPWDEKLNLMMGVDE